VSSSRWHVGFAAVDSDRVRTLVSLCVVRRRSEVANSLLVMVVEEEIEVRDHL
jgi:hypothetical protein